MLDLATIRSVLFLDTRLLSLSGGLLDTSRGGRGRLVRYR